jgi:hypothetical protein
MDTAIEEPAVLDVLPPAPSEPVTEGGMWLSFTGLPHLLVGVVAWVVGAAGAVATMESLPLFLFDARVGRPGDSPQGSSAGKERPESKPRLRFLMTSVFNDIGRTRP